jgi:hypothetical protein
MGRKARLAWTGVLFVVALGLATASAEVCNIKVVTDASPDYSDMDSMIYSITARWPSPAEMLGPVLESIARRQASR